MNRKIKKYLDEIEKTEKKIADLEMYLKGVRSALKEEENNEMIKSIRGMKLKGQELFDLLNGIQDGTISFVASGAVSYTHLDVYKRQVYRERGLLLLW